MNEMPLISIITPSFNQVAFLPRTLESVRGQLGVKVEHLVVDGGSSDGSLDVIRQHASHLAWWVSEHDDGQSDAINKGLRRANGEILAWLNSDDVYCPGALEAVAHYFKNHPDHDVVVGDLEIIDETDQTLDVKKALPVPYRWNLYSGCAIPQPATFFTRRAYEIVGGLDVSLHYQMDYDFFLRMQAQGMKFGHLKRPLARFRLHSTSKTVAEYDRRFWQDFARIQDRYDRTIFSGRWREGRRALLKKFTRLEMFLARAFLRGVWLPSRYARVRRRVFNGS